MLNIPPNQQNSQMSAEDAKASLGIVTALMQQLMPKASVEGQEAPGEAETPETLQDTIPDETGAKIADLEGKFGELEKTVKETIQKEIGGIKEMIAKALNENEDGKEE